MVKAHYPAMIQGLLLADSYAHPVRHIALQETHISWVILTGDYAYKIKKPVRFSFLDFSTLQQRHYFCRREYERNRLYSPDLYLQVLTINHDEGRYVVGGKGEVVDYCLQMHQFDQADVFLHRMEQGTFDPYWVDVLAHHLARQHQTAVRASEGWDASALLYRHMQDNIECCRASHPMVAQVEECWKAAYLAQQKALQQRHHDGYVCHCHGDYHLANIALFRNQPTAFDCIEFNDDYSVIDTLNDAAFLVMDCGMRGRSDLAMRFLSRYLEQSDDYSGLKLLPLYLAYRAAVRAKVTHLQEEACDGGAQAVQQQSISHAYWQYAQAALAQHSPQLFVVAGFSGSGKSYLSLLGCGVEQAVVIRSDALRKRLHAEHYAAFPLYGKRMNQHTCTALFDAADRALAAGCSVILDATFIAASWRNKARQLAAQHGVTLTMYWLDPPREQVLAHIRQRTAEGRDVSDADEAIVRQQWQQCSTPQDDDLIILHHSNHWPRSSLN
jgi:hypothetical protein